MRKGIKMAEKQENNIRETLRRAALISIVLVVVLLLGMAIMGIFIGDNNLPLNYDGFD